MRTTVFKQDGIVHVEYDTALKATISTWQNLGPHDYMVPSMNAEIDWCKENEVRVCIVDTSEATGVPSQEEQNWYADFAYPAFQAAGVKAIITVIPKSAISKLATSQWNKTGSQFEIDFIDAPTMEEAIRAAKVYISS